jgi:hypothetical protein
MATVMMVELYQQMASSPYTSGATVTVKAPGAMSNSGFSFTGWDTNNDGIAEFTGSGSETFAISANTTLKAVWASSSSPILAITGTPLDHGSVCPTTAATPITYTITNSGGASAAGITVVSSDAQFVVSGLSSTTIAASGGTATYNVTFTPSSAGSKTATITVSKFYQRQQFAYQQFNGNRNGYRGTSGKYFCCNCNNCFICYYKWKCN